MDSLGSYGNLSLMTNNGTSSMWTNNHQYHQIHEDHDIFSQEMTNPMINVPQHISPPNPISVVPNKPHNNVVLLRTPSPFSDFGISNIPTKTVSVDSLDCLYLSATDSINTDTSIDDDGIFSSPQQPSQSPCYEITKIPSSTSKRTYDQMTQVLSFEGGENFKNSKQSKKAKILEKSPHFSNISFQQPSNSSASSDELDSEAIQQMKEMVYRAAAFRPMNLGVEVADKPKRKNVKISSDPQTVAARQRRERISERIRVLQRLVPGGNKMDTASMLDEAANYLKFLRSQVKALEGISGNYKLDHQVNFNNHHLMTLESMNNHSLFSMHNLFPYQITPSSLLQPKY